MKEKKIIVKIPTTLYNELKKNFDDPPEQILKIASRKYLDKLQC